MKRTILGKTGLEVNRMGFGGIPIPDLIEENIHWLDEEYKS